ncbi:uncharacterized protein BXZ73DRAFT_47672, partial [Epithele typhae]|uniref:uncharacterized protein n=1 Tax=Epithele typhae TaxID=378194 RepID=UPI0020072490
LRVVVQDDRIAIGVSKRCCFCCNLLARLITNRLPGPAKLILPATHSTVFAWYPPEGLPVEICRP